MILYLQAVTTVSNLIIDYIEVQLESGQIISMNWDESAIDRESHGFSARYKGVCFNEEDGDGRIAELQSIKVIDVCLYSETETVADFTITSMEFIDGDKSMLIKGPIFSVKGCAMVG